MKESRFAILPVYLVLDASVSMKLNRAFEIAIQFVFEILDRMSESATVADKLRLEVITFDREARTVFPLGTRDELYSWLNQLQAHPLEADGGATHYGQAFALLRAQIALGVQQILSEIAQESEHFSAYRPVVIFITDGKPNDDAAARNAAYQSLIDPGFEARPNVICVGVADATVESLSPYGAGKYHTPDNRYTGGNKNLVFVSRDGVSPAEALGDILEVFINSIVHSVHSAEQIMDDGDEMADPFTKALGENVGLLSEAFEPVN